MGRALQERIVDVGSRDPRLLSATLLMPVVSQLVTYRRGAVSVLVEGIERILTEYEVQGASSTRVP